MQTKHLSQKPARLLAAATLAAALATAAAATQTYSATAATYPATYAGSAALIDYSVRPFVGVFGAAGNSEFDSQIRGERFENLDDTVFDVGVMAGVRFWDVNRVYVSLSHQTRAQLADTPAYGDTFDRWGWRYPRDYGYDCSWVDSLEWQMDKVAVGYDFIPRLGYQLRGVVGLYAGVAKVSGELVYTPQVLDETQGKWVWDTQKRHKDLDETEFLLGFRFGGMLEITANHAVELGIKGEWVGDYGTALFYLGYTLTF